MTITTDDAISLLCLVKGDSSDETKKAARVALATALQFMLASGAEGFDFLTDTVTLITTANQTTYYINKVAGLAGGTTTIQSDKRIGIIKNAWYNKLRVVKMTKEDFLDRYQGETTTGEPRNCTAFGNKFLIGPIPADAYSLTILVSQMPSTIEEVPEEKQFAVIYAALAFMFPPTRDYMKAYEDRTAAIQALVASDGILDTEHLEGAFDQWEK